MRHAEGPVVKALLEALAYGCPRADACRLAGFPMVTFRKWMRIGKDPENKGKPSRYRVFRRSVLQAEAKAIAERVQVIHKAGQRDWRASAWLLERMRPETFARPDQREQQRQLPYTGPTTAIAIQVDLAPYMEVAAKILPGPAPAALPESVGKGAGVSGRQLNSVLDQDSTSGNPKVEVDPSAGEEAPVNFSGGNSGLPLPDVEGETRGGGI